MLHAVIMAGGSGTRFWPESRTAQPKQLLSLLGGRTMIQGTVDRLGDLVSPDRVMVVTNRALVGPIAEQLPELPREALIGEPCKRDTAPCIGLAAAIIAKRDPDAVMVVMPADHVIQPDESFQAAVQHAASIVEGNPGRVVTFGIRPSYAAESFGYIERGEVSDEPDDSGPTSYAVKSFHEKPSAEVAEQYLASGGFYWNSGIFLWNARTILDALRKFEPEMHRHLEAIADALETADFADTLDREFSAIQGKSIDYAVMERYDDVVVIEAPFEWDDLGSWRSLARLRGSDESGNTVVGRHLGIDTRSSIIRTDEDHLIVTLGMEDCIIVHTPHATLVARKHDEEAIRDVVAQLKEKEWDEFL